MVAGGDFPETGAWLATLDQHDFEFGFVGFRRDHSRRQQEGNASQAETAPAHGILRAISPADAAADWTW